LSLGYPKRFGYVGIRDAFEVAQNNCRSVKWRQLVENLAHAASLGVAKKQDLGIGVLGGQGFDVKNFAGNRVRGSSTACPELVEAHIGRDADDPSPQPIAAVKARQPLEDAQEGLLGRLLGVVGVAEHAPAHTAHSRLVAFMDGFVGVAVAALEGKREGTLLGCAGGLSLRGEELVRSLGSHLVESTLLLRPGSAARSVAGYRLRRE
jgi:hypothetical protein